MTEQEVFMINAWGEAYGSQRAHLKLDVTQGLLNLSEPQREYPQKMSSLSVLLPQLAVKDISSDQHLNHCHRFICYGSV